MAAETVCIGVTGGIGSGKTTVCRIFAILGAPVYYADQRARILMNTDNELIEAILQAFGSDAYTPEGMLNRPYLAQTVFPDRDKLEELNGLVHPKVAEDFDRWLSEPKQRQSAYTIKEAALLFETGSYKALKATIAVVAPEAEKIRRVLLRDAHRDKQQVQQIIKNQMRDRERMALADYVIQNDGATPLIPQVQRLHQLFGEWKLPK